MPSRRSGIEALRKIRPLHPDVLVIMVTAYEEIDTVISAMKLGASDYVVKPIHMEGLEVTVRNALETIRLRKEVQILQEKYLKENLPCFIGESNEIQDVMEFVGMVAKSPDTPIFILGETGTGKELIASAIHYRSPNFKGPFITVNCAAIPRDLIESELFGYEKGAFTGANKRRIGRFEQCDHGTILLDEVGDMALSTQAKVLRVLQEGELVRIGGNETIKVDVRVLASTHKKLDELIKQEKFREDLYYRLKIMSIVLPPLRERKEDVQELAEYFFHLYNQQLGKQVSYIEPPVFDKLRSYHWPGNVRELGNTIKRALILCKGEILAEEEIVFDVEEQKTSFSSEEELENMLIKKMDPLFTDLLHFWGKGLRSNLVKKIEKFLIQKALSETRGNQVQAAKLLGISRNTLRNRIEKYGL